MNQQSSCHWWIGLFAGRLWQRQPRAHWFDVVQRAVAAYHRAAALDPLEAADRYSRSHELAVACRSSPSVAERRALSPRHAGAFSHSAAGVGGRRPASDAALAAPARARAH